MGDNSQAKDFGERSLAAAQEAKDDVWQLNASVLIAQSEGRWQYKIRTVYTRNHVYIYKYLQSSQVINNLKMQETVTMYYSVLYQLYFYYILYTMLLVCILYQLYFYYYTIYHVSCGVYCINYTSTIYYIPCFLWCVLYQLYFYYIYYIPCFLCVDCINFTSTIYYIPCLLCVYCINYTSTIYYIPCLLCVDCSQVGRITGSPGQL